MSRKARRDRGTWILLAAVAATAAALILTYRPLLAGPAVAATGIAGAFVVFLLKEKSERRRKTLDVYEKQIYDRDLRTAISTVVTAVRTGTYQDDSELAHVGSHRDLTSFIINYLEATCEGASAGLYDREMLRDLLDTLASWIIDHFLTKTAATPLASGRFLDQVTFLKHTRALFPEKFSPRS